FPYTTLFRSERLSRSYPQCASKVTRRDHRVRQVSQAFAGEIPVQRRKLRERLEGAGLQGTAASKPAHEAGTDFGFRRGQTRRPGLSTPEAAGRAVDRT